ncbi:MAG TPA: DUF1003 domain-containing protein [Caulobacteraceae bacterium]|jgi:uncharacterized membrane protein|nr:DUF1003 domain-containing protein [Caulobacteraceae bacterium]
MADEALPIPAHIEETVQSIARLQAQHDSRATPGERLMERMTGLIGRPRFLVWLAAGVIGWTLANTAALKFAHGALDPPPFYWLQGVASMSAFTATVIILITQRRADSLASLRAQLTLELAILGEQKTAKVIDLLEEHRRDNPLMANRPDPEARDMAKPADPDVVLEAIVAAPEPEDEGGDEEGG